MTPLHGGRDTVCDPDLRDSTEADAQGRARYERAGSMHRAAGARQVLVRPTPALGYACSLPGGEPCPT